MTPIKKILTTDDQQQFRRDAKSALATLAAIASLTLAWYAAQSEAAPPDSAAERAMLASCRLPERDGAATVYARVDGKIFCWRMK